MENNEIMNATEEVLETAANEVGESTLLVNCNCNVPKSEMIEISILTAIGLELGRIGVKMAIKKIKAIREKRKAKKQQDIVVPLGAVWTDDGTDDSVSDET